MVRRVKVRGLDSIADFSDAIYLETSASVRASLDSKMALSGGLLTGNLLLSSTAAVTSSNVITGAATRTLITAGTSSEVTTNTTGNGYVEILGPGAAPWTLFDGLQYQPRRGGIELLQQRPCWGRVARVH